MQGAEGRGGDIIYILPTLLMFALFLTLLGLIINPIIARHEYRTDKRKRARARRHRYGKRLR